MGQGMQAVYRAVGTGQKVAVGAGTVQTANVIGNGITDGSAAGVTVAYLFSTVDCWVEIGPNPTAAVDTSTRIPANTPMFLKCTANDKVAFIQDSTGGFAWARSMAENV